ncbi:MAG: helix-turn-helix transcriptional regulator [Thermoanaerobaculia bacterium]
MSATPLTDALLPDLGLAFRFLREQRRMQQAELARRAHIGKSQVSLYENGKQAPNLETMLRLLAALEADFHDLHNAIKIAGGKLDQVCSGMPNRDEQAAAEKIAQGLALLLQLPRKSN